MRNKEYDFANKFFKTTEHVLRAIVLHTMIGWHGFWMVPPHFTSSLRGFSLAPS